MPLVAHPLLRRVGDAVCTTDRAQRLRIARSLLAAAIYAGCLTITNVAACLGLADPAQAQAATVVVCAGVLGFYALLRSGWNRRLADPAMTFAQMLFAVAAIMLYYAMLAPIRSAMLLVMCQTLAFGMLTLTPRQVRRLAGCTAIGFCATAALLAGWRPEIYDPRLEVIHVVVVVAVLATVTALSSEFGQLRARLRRQRGDLTQALERLETLIRRDELTGLVNRRCMWERLDEEEARRTPSDLPASLCMIDLDHFKRVNDLHGHAAGDAVLRRFADTASACLRSIDVLARWGGEEFLLLMPSTDAAAAEPLLQRLRDALADPRAWHDMPHCRGVTFSAGLTTWRPAEPADAAIDRADRAAYRAKDDGRDRWCTA